MLILIYIFFSKFFLILDNALERSNSKSSSTKSIKRVQFSSDSIKESQTICDNLRNCSESEQDLTATNNNNINNNNSTTNNNDNMSNTTNNDRPSFLVSTNFSLKGFSKHKIKDSKYLKFKKFKSNFVNLRSMFCNMINDHN